tara:strand:+ start:690 stop:1073 length:384 start_codon:yes stop_codon:yes gene_type:complete
MKEPMGKFLSTIKKPFKKKYKKENIPKKVRCEVWRRYVGEQFRGKCWTSWCSNALCCLDSWEVGHNIPESKGGTLSLDNLRPICSDCNKGMGDRMSIEEWDERFASSEEKVFDILVEVCERERAKLI